MTTNYHTSLFLSQLENVRTTTDLGPEEAEIEARKKSLMQILLDILSEVFILISIPADGDAS